MSLGGFLDLLYGNLFWLALLALLLIISYSIYVYLEKG